jgi:nucleoside-diphosphate-sugar epimerase
MNLAGETVLVTGGTGFIGGRLVEKLVLEQGCQVRVLVRNFANASRIASFPVDLMPGDITDRVALERATEGCHAVFHCAYGFVPALDAQRRIGVNGTELLAEVANQRGVRRFVHLSTFAVYSPAAAGDLTEESPWPASRDSYVLVKREAERRLLQMHERDGLPVVVLQPTLVYGPFSRFWTLAPVERLQKGLVPLIDGGVGLCNAVYVDDVVDAMILAASRPGVEGETFLVSAEEPVTWKMYFAALEEAVGRPATIKLAEAEVRRLIQRRNARSRFSHRLARRAASPALWEQLASTPVGRVVRSLVPAKLGAAASRWSEGFLRDAAPVLDGSGKPRRLALPNEGQIAVQTSRARVRIDKARDLLGYSPRFDLERGMTVTRHFLEWANLVRPEKPPLLRERGVRPTRLPRRT